MNKILVIDNYDSFTYNLVHLIGSVDPNIEVYRNDKITSDEIAEKAPKAIVLSPGPKTPNDAGICLEVVERFGSEIPIFGVCLGHQSIGQVFGADVVHARRLMHGKTSKVRHNGEGLFKGLNQDGIVATRYHSLTLDPDTIGDHLEVTAKSDDGMIMAVAHKSLPIHSVQFHPESIASESGAQMISNFLEIADAFNKSAERG
ncbi:anthranilate synthase component II [Maritalea mediterranea]|uniref:Aminodeoxychorismate/anthranilate synthase component II n=1 Tax=Maritalea mediterranea TaxID=2909667 RepID=A0ABS9EAS9_9HYPH|nr:aminodeoxychorismate/anthranilate synthase component II [Maritalea mediterranea]MCF4098538.1 aminodeoxychorismate/anthranilate synthase component II [Maritalea mediterranea]